MISTEQIWGIRDLLIFLSFSDFSKKSPDILVCTYCFKGRGMDFGDVSSMRKRSVSPTLFSEVYTNP